MGAGILSAGQVRELSKEVGPNGYTRTRIRRPSGQDLKLGASAIDLPLGESYWVMEGSCRSGPHLAVRDLIDHHAVGGQQTLAADTRLEKGRVYLIQVDCEVDLRDTEILGKSTGRSSIGRLDVLVRMLVDNATAFDLLPKDSHGLLYVEVAPITFDLLVSPGTCLSQLRLFRGREELFTLSMEQLRYEEPFPVVDADGSDMRDPCERAGSTYPFSLDLPDDPRGDRCGFVAKKDPPEPVDPEKRGFYDPTRFWDLVYRRKGALILETDRLYILRSKERLRLPGDLAVECQAYTETLGEWRVEYAGFAHPWFGFSNKNGTPIIFEVRGHNVPTILRDGLHLGEVSFRRMSKRASEEWMGPEKQQYEQQELKLSSCFSDWPSQA